MLTAQDTIRKKAQQAHAQQQHLIAEQCYRTLLEQEPNLDDAINLGALLRSQKRLAEASLLYQKWTSYFGIDVRLILNACNCWNDNNEPHLVIENLEPLLNKSEISLQLKLCFTDALHRLGRFKECISLLKQWHTSEPNGKEILIRLGLAYAKNQDLPNALEAFSEVNRIDPSNLEMVSNRITILKDLGRFKEAESLIEQLSNNQKLQVDVAQATAGLWMAQNKLVEATQLFQHVCEQRPYESNFWLNWASALRGLRRTVAPYKALQRGLCYEPNNTDLQEALQQILGEMAKPEAASRCRLLWPYSDKQLKASYLFSRQFLGIGEGKKRYTIVSRSSPQMGRRMPKRYSKPSMGRHNP